MKPILFSALFFFMAQIAVAQAPLQFNYQAVARNTAGAPLANQTINLRLSIRTGTASGAVQYSETRSITTNAFGLFAVAVGGPGASSTTGAMSDVTWDNGDKYLQVELDPSGGSNFTSMGTTQLLSVPYALKSADNQWSVFNGTNIRSRNTGNVYIGAQSYNPGKLNVYTNGSLQNGLHVLAEIPNTVGASIILKGQHQDWAIIGTNQNANAGENKFVIYDVGRTESRLVVDTIGRVGIGVEDPLSRLHVGGGAIIKDRLGVGTSAPAYDIHLSHNKPTLGFTDESENHFSGSIKGDSSNLVINAYRKLLLGSNTAGNLVLQTSDANSTAGYVGIGTATPTDKVDVVGNIRLSGELHHSTNSNINLIPLAYGKVYSAGDFGSPVPNFTVNKVQTGQYEITVTGHSLSVNYDVFFVQPRASGLVKIANGIITDNGHLMVHIYALNGTPVDSVFDFIIYKP